MNSMHRFPAVKASLRNAAERKNASIVTYVATHGPCTFALLLDLFGDKPADVGAQKRLRNCLAYLAHQGRLRAVGGCAKREWRLGHFSPVSDSTPPPPPASMSDAVPALKWVGQITPARQINWQQAGDYKPSQHSTQRAGSLDFATLPSRGLRC